MAGCEVPDHLYSKCAAGLTFCTKGGRKQAMHSPPGLRTLR